MKEIDLESMMGWVNMFDVRVGIRDCPSMISLKGSHFGQNNNENKQTKNPHAIHHL